MKGGRCMKFMKRFLSLALCAGMVLGGAGVVNAQEGSMASTRASVGERYTGNVDIAKYLRTEGSYSEDGSVYNGKLVAEIDTDELFRDAYENYLELLKVDDRRANLVMFSEKKSFPSFVYTVNFPEEVDVDDINIKTGDNSFTISKISYEKVGSNSLKFTFNLGNWNDYGTFYSNYAKELNDGLKQKIDIEIPYSASSDEIDGTEKITADGYCKLYYFKKILFFETVNNIVDITTDKAELDLINTMY